MRGDWPAEPRLRRVTLAVRYSCSDIPAITIAETGVLSGTPTQPGASPVILVVTNGRDGSDTQSFTITTR